MLKSMEKKNSTYTDLISCYGSTISKKSQPQIILNQQGKWLMGYGACSRSGCPCRAYEDTYGSDLCNNCGHKFTDHW